MQHGDAGVYACVKVYVCMSVIQRGRVLSVCMFAGLCDTDKKKEMTVSVYMFAFVCLYMYLCARVCLSVSD